MLVTDLPSPARKNQCRTRRPAPGVTWVWDSPSHLASLCRVHVTWLPGDTTRLLMDLPRDEAGLLAWPRRGSTAHGNRPLPGLGALGVGGQCSGWASRARKWAPQCTGAPFCSDVVQGASRDPGPSVLPTAGVSSPPSHGRWGDTWEERLRFASLRGTIPPRSRPVSRSPAFPPGAVRVASDRNTREETPAQLPGARNESGREP